MRFSVDAKRFAQAVKQVASAVGRHAPIAVLNTIHMTDRGGSVVLTAGDMDTFIETTVDDVDLEASGAVCVPARLFASATAAATGTVTVEVDGDEIMLSGDGYETALRGIDADEYPKVDWGDCAPVSFADTWPAVLGVMFAVSEDQARPILTGIHFNGTVVEATDSYRAARATIPDLGGEALVPGAAVKHADRMLDSGAITMAVTERTVRFEDGETRIVGRLIEEKFPNVAAVYPTSHEHELVVDAKELSAAVAAIEFVDSSQHRAVRLAFEDGTLTVSRRDDSDGTIAERTVDATGSLPGPVAISAPYLKDALDGIDGDATLKLTDEKKPIQVEGVEGIDQIVMPVRIS